MSNAFPPPYLGGYRYLADNYDCRRVEVKEVSRMSDSECFSVYHHLESHFCMPFSFYPSVFILLPGQHLHINKGRLHCFRKASPESLSLQDCHYKLREELIATTPHPSSYVFLSIAYDWYVPRVVLSLYRVLL